MLSSLRKLFVKGGDHSGLLVLPQNEEFSFSLKLKDIEVGELSCKNGQWYFCYTDEFKSLSNEYYPIVGFNDLNKVYKSDSLWPFFLIRIPGLGQPYVRQLIEKEGIDITNEAQLLGRFGHSTIANPFILVNKENLEPA
ncbi:MAG: hypothetical protein R2787_00495 [Saprospiraceae bacterium]